MHLLVKFQMRLTAYLATKNPEKFALRVHDLELNEIDKCALNTPTKTCILRNQVFEAESKISGIRCHSCALMVPPWMAAVTFIESQILACNFLHANSCLQIFACVISLIIKIVDERYKVEPDNVLSERVGLALVHMVRRIEEDIERAARHNGLHPTDFRCIGYLHTQGQPVSPKDIIAYLSLTSGSGTALLDRLEMAGFASRVRNPKDRRSVLIVLDAQAAAEPIALFERIQAKYITATADFSSENLEAIATYLERIQTLTEEVNRELGDSVQPLSNAS